jgi:hypothetical protein
VWNYKLDMVTRIIHRVTLDGKTYVSFETLPADLRSKYADYEEYMVDQKQWWVALSYKPVRRSIDGNPLGSRFVMLSNSVIMRKATKKEIQHYRSPELVRVRL